MDHNTLIALVYVTLPALFTLACVLFATFCPATIQEAPQVRMQPAQAATMHEVAYVMYVNRHATATSTASYWQRVASQAVNPEMRAKAMMYAKMYGNQASEYATKAHRVMYG